MPLVSDRDLLGEFARTGSEAAFGELVRRHIGLVHSVALRQTNQSHQAEEITQAVFIILARKAASLGGNVVLSGWLYHTARLTAANLRRTEFRRMHREQEAFMASTQKDPPTDLAWLELSPLLDEAMARLGATDRDAVVLRYFENKNLSEVGAALGLKERAAQKRVHRALEKLRKYFTSRGVTPTAALIAATLSAHSVQAAPAALAQTVTMVAVAKGATAGGSILTLSQEVLKIMTWTKIKTTIAVGVVALLAAGTATVAVNKFDLRRHPWKTSHPDLSWEISGADFMDFYKAQPQVSILPTKFAANGKGCLSDNRRGAMGIAQPLENITCAAFQKDRLHTVFLTDLPTNRYDFLAKLVAPQQPHKNMAINENWAVELQRALSEKFGITGRLEKRPTDVLALTPASSGVRGFSVSHQMPKGRAMIDKPGDLAFFEQPVATLTHVVQKEFNVPIVDATGLDQDYDYAIQWPEPDAQHPNLDGLKQALHDQLGLDLIPTNLPVEMLVVDRTK